MKKNDLKVKFKKYTLPMPDKNDDKLIIQFLTVTTLIGLSNNTIEVNFKKKGVNYEN